MRLLVKIAIVTKREEKYSILQFWRIHFEEFTF